MSTISDRFQHWLQPTSTVSNLLTIVTWVGNHPVLSIIIFLLSLVAIGKVVKGLDKLLEVAGLSALKAVIKFFWRVIKWLLVSVSRLTGWGWEKLLIKPERTNDVALPQPIELTIDSHGLIASEIQKQQRLQEIQTRLEAIAQEQNQLLQEASQLLSEKQKVIP